MFRVNQMISIRRPKQCQKFSRDTFMYMLNCHLLDGDLYRALSLPKFLDLPTDFSINICTTILLVKKLPMKSPTKSLRW
jgi:hypothetical protein